MDGENGMVLSVAGERLVSKAQSVLYAHETMLEPLVSISGVRGVVGGSFTEDIVRRWAAAFAASLRATEGSAAIPLDRDQPRGSPRPAAGGARGDACIVLGRDPRPSGEWALRVVTETLVEHGIRPIMLGVVPTPTAQLAVTYHAAAGGLVITGSHNPAEWNALKFLGPDGVFLSAEEMEKLHRGVRASEPSKLSNLSVTPSHTGIASALPRPDAIHDADAIKRHLENILKLPVDEARIRARRFRVVVDPVNGAGALALPPLLERLGGQVTVINGDPHGEFAHPPEPTPANLSGLGDAVRAAHADLGLAVDPDADRLVLVDETGTVLSEEYTVTLAALAVLSDRRQRAERSDEATPSGLLRFARHDERAVVVNLSTTRMVDDVAARFGARVARTPVGERYVVEGMRAHRAVIGGEGNGGVIFAPSHEGRDSLVGAALVLDLLARRGDTLSQLCAELPRYLMRKEKLPRGDAWDHERSAAALVSEFPEAQLSTLDGVRVDAPAGWVHLRPSNTEPVIRLIAEARTADLLTSLLARVRHALAVPAVR